MSGSRSRRKAPKSRSGGKARSGDEAAPAISANAKADLKTAQTPKSLNLSASQLSFAKRTTRWLRRFGLRIGMERFVELDILAVIIGVVAGLATVAYRKLIDLMTMVFSFMTVIRTPLIPIGLILMPAVGGLLVGVAAPHLGREAAGEGVPEVMKSLALEGGRMRARLPVVKAVLSSLTLGSGGSAGSEGPIGQIGAGVGSAIGQLFKLGAPELRVLTVSGISAGIAAIFNAPIGGALFGLEIVMVGIEPVALIPVLIATVAGTATTAAFFGNNTWFSMPTYQVLFGPELLLFVLLGLLVGLLSVVWIRSLMTLDGVFHRVPIRAELKPALGGLLVGVILVYLPQIAGIGYETTAIALNGGLLLVPLLLLTLGKMLGTSCTLGSGGSGGMLAPSLFVGAMAGGALGLLFKAAMPGMLTPAMAFAVVGMAALFAGAARAPLTCVILVAETTRDYGLLVPLMAACATSYLVSSLLHRESIYSWKLSRQGIQLKRQLIIDILDAVRVREVMITQGIVFARPNMQAFQVLELAYASNHSTLPVLEGDHVLGIVSLREAYDAVRGDLPPEKTTVAKIATMPAPTVFEDDTVHAALDVMIQTSANLVCVVDRKDPSRFIGIVSHGDILKAHDLERVPAPLLNE
jgi:CIC family chloride channel protein